MSNETEQPLLMGRMLRCPSCKRWEPIESYTQLMLPPDFTRQCAQIYKCSGPEGCKFLFSLAGT